MPIFIRSNTSTGTISYLVGRGVKDQQRLKRKGFKTAHSRDHDFRSVLLCFID